MTSRGKQPIALADGGLAAGLLVLYGMSERWISAAGNGQIHTIWNFCRLSGLC